MNAPFLSIRSRLLTFLALLLSASHCLAAENQPAVVRVKAMLGLAQFSRSGGAFSPLGPGMVLRAGDMVQTATGSAVDLYLGEIAGTVRLMESATLVVDKITTNAAAGFEVELSLRAGELAGTSKPVPEGSRLEIKITHGLAQIVEGRFRIDAAANCVLTQGRLLFAHVPPGREPSVQTLTAPPATYFTPDQGIQPAPKELVREIDRQLRSKLPRR